jgi:hypothetical protein
MRSLAAAALAAAMATAPAWAAGEFSHEGWTGRALVKDGSLIQCQMFMSAITNYDLILTLNPDGELRLGLRSHKIDVGWSMLFQQKFGLRIQIDDGPVLTKTFVAKTPTAVSTSLNGTDWEKRLPNGKKLRINTGRVRVFHLNGIKEAMGKLRACVAKHRTA